VDTAPCPECGFTVRSMFSRLNTGNAMLVHMYGHLHIYVHTPRWMREEYRACWCGGAFTFHSWANHMKGIDPQAHYLARGLGIAQ
jgi:hypothetical protein